MKSFENAMQHGGDRLRLHELDAWSTKKDCSSFGILGAEARRVLDARFRGTIP
jgi:hypothetical protein